MTSSVGDEGLGTVVVLNGAPRSGKSSVARAMQESFPEPWLNVGVDSMMSATPTEFRPGIGLRPGGERPDLEHFVAACYASLFDSVSAFARHALSVVVDAGIHDDYSKPLGVLADAAERLVGLRAFLVGVHCDLDVIMERRRAGLPAGDPIPYLTAKSDGSIPPPVALWQEAVHIPGTYDLEVDSSVSSPASVAERIGKLIEHGEPTAFELIRSATSP